MLIIIITVITQGVRVPENLRGNLSGSLFVRDGVFQAIGVISFGKGSPKSECRPTYDRHRLTWSSIRMPYASTPSDRVLYIDWTLDHNSLLIYGSLKKPTIDRFARITHYSTAISMVACLALALAGFLTFGDKTLGNVLNNFPKDNIMVNIARL